MGSTTDGVADMGAAVPVPRCELVPCSPSSRPFRTVDIPQSANYGLLEKAGYVEEEFFISGTADVVDAKAGVVRAAVPYTTRILVRRPKDPQRFSGTVWVEPFHIFLETMPGWMASHRYVLGQGDAWVGVTVAALPEFAMGGAYSALRTGQALLQQADPVRYSRISLQPGTPGWTFADGMGVVDSPLNIVTAGKVGQAMFAGAMPQAPGIFAQVGALARADVAGAPFAGFPVEHVYATGYSQTGMFMRAFVDNYHAGARRPDGGPVYEAYIVGVMLEPASRPRDAVVVALPSETEVAAYAAAGWTSSPDSDDPPFRVYELAGTAHVLSPSQFVDMEAATHQAGLPTFPAPDCAPTHSPMPQFRVVHAIYHNIDRWVRDGTPMPRADRIERDPSAPDGIARDEHGNAKSGVRAPWVDVLDATYLPFCVCGGPGTAVARPFGADEMDRLYGDTATYRKHFGARVDELVRERFLLEADAAVLRRDPLDVGFP